MFNLTTKEIKYLINQSKTIKNGSECVFIQLNNEVGIKLYRKENERNESLENQKVLSKHKLSPSVGKKINILFQYNFRTYQYGFLTEIVKTINSDNFKYYSKAERKFYDKQLKTLKNKLSKINYHFLDDHEKNIGYKNGKMVLIDTGPLSF